MRRGLPFRGDFSVAGNSTATEVGNKCFRQETSTKNNPALVAMKN